MMMNSDLSGDDMSSSEELQAGRCRGRKKVKKATGKPPKPENSMSINLNQKVSPLAWLPLEPGLPELAKSPYFFIIDPATPPVAFTEDTFKMFYELFTDHLHTYIQSQHVGIRLCTLCWSFIGRKSKIAYEATDKHEIPPEYTLFEAFGALDECYEEKFRKVSQMFQKLLNRGFRPLCRWTPDNLHRARAINFGGGDRGIVAAGRNGGGFTRRKGATEGDGGGFTRFYSYLAEETPWVPSFPKFLKGYCKHNCFGYFLGKAGGNLDQMGDTSGNGPGAEIFREAREKYIRLGANQSNGDGGVIRQRDMESVMGYEEFSRNSMWGPHQDDDMFSIYRGSVERDVMAPHKHVPFPQQQMNFPYEVDMSRNQFIPASKCKPEVSKPIIEQNENQGVIIVTDQNTVSASPNPNIPEFDLPKTIDIIRNDPTPDNPESYGTFFTRRLQETLDERDSEVRNLIPPTPLGQERQPNQLEPRFPPPPQPVPQMQRMPNDYCRALPTVEYTVPLLSVCPPLHPPPPKHIEQHSGINKKRQPVNPPGLPTAHDKYLSLREDGDLLVTTIRDLLGLSSLKIYDPHTNQLYTLSLSPSVSVNPTLMPTSIQKHTRGVCWTSPVLPPNKQGVPVTMYSDREQRAQLTLASSTSASSGSVGKNTQNRPLPSPNTTNHLGKSPFFPDSSVSANKPSTGGNHDKITRKSDVFRKVVKNWVEAVYPYPAWGNGQTETPNPVSGVIGPRGVQDVPNTTAGGNAITKQEEVGILTRPQPPLGAKSRIEPETSTFKAKGLN